MKKVKSKPKCTYADHPTWYGKVWHFLAHEDSWASFIVDAILIVLLGKFVIYPAIGFALGTSYPIVAVVSDSMDHHGLGFDEWWAKNGAWYESHNITKEQFAHFYKPNGFKKGDVFVVKGVRADQIKAGDILVYSVPYRPDPIIHRVIAVKDHNGQLIFETKGDANPDQIFFEKEINESQIHGKAVAWAPLLGWPKTLLVQALGIGKYL